MVEKSIQWEVPEKKKFMKNKSKSKFNGKNKLLILKVEIQNEQKCLPIHLSIDFCSCFVFGVLVSRLIAPTLLYSFAGTSHFTDSKQQIETVPVNCSSIQNSFKLNARVTLKTG